VENLSFLFYSERNGTEIDYKKWLRINSKMSKDFWFEMYIEKENNIDFYNKWGK